MPHLLIAGSTGSGKSVCINSLISCFLLHNTPEDLRLVLVDPKRVELAGFAPIPHLAFSKIITDSDEIVGTLQAIIHEMDSRYRRFAAIGVRNLEGWNKSPKANHKLPHWVVVIDELADLMMAAPFEVERQICRLAQLARATGIHLILATQRPSVDVITGLIKANIPARVAFQVSAKVDSRTILDQMGAEALLGQGDMLYLPPGTGIPQRVHGAFVSDQEVHRVVDYLKQAGEPQYVPGVLDSPDLEDEAVAEGEGLGSESDPLYDQAVAIVLKTRRPSISLVQRHLRIGYNRAARLIEQMERAGMVSPMGASGNREVLSPATDER
jgi:S-DNA-T family DNA segregation ATPase FtsK/SpoIIIE